LPLTRNQKPPCLSLHLRASAVKALLPLKLEYVVAKSLDGLFFMLGEEEKKIRTNPAAQTTSLLKQVFGKKN
jgi:hypothetical protein